MLAGSFQSFFKASCVISGGASTESCCMSWFVEEHCQHLSQCITVKFMTINGEG